MSLHIVGDNLIHRYQTYYEQSVSNGVLKLVKSNVPRQVEKVVNFLKGCTACAYNDELYWIKNGELYGLIGDKRYHFETSYDLDDVTEIRKMGENNFWITNSSGFGRPIYI